MAKTPKPRKPKKPPVVPPPPPVDPADIPLDEDEQRFVDEYLIDRKSTMAYRRVFPGTSYNTAQRRGREFRERPNVCREITSALRSQSIRTQITADKALQEIARVAYSDILDLYDPDTYQLANPRNIPYNTRKAIASVKMTKGRKTETTKGKKKTTITESVVEYRLWNKMDALQKLCAHLGLNTAITPLDALLQALPRELATSVREALAVTDVAAPRIPVGSNGTSH